MRIRQAIGVTKNVFKATLLLFTLLFTGCSDNVIIPDGDEDYYADACKQEAPRYRPGR